MQSLCGNVKDTQVLIDDTTAGHSFNNMCSCKSLSRESEVRKKWVWAIIRINFITARHTPDIMNVDVEVFFKKSCSQKFRKIHRKTTAPESLF